MLIVDALNKPEVLAFYRKNGFETLFTTEQQEDFYVNPPWMNNKKDSTSCTFFVKNV